MDRKLNISFIVLFFVCLVTPSLYISDAEVSQVEKRALAKYVPLFKENGNMNMKFHSDFENYFTDRFFLRENLLELHNSCKSVFPTGRYRYNKNVVVGDEDWIFFRGDGSDINFLNYSSIDASELEKGCTYLKDIQNFCEENGKQFICFIAPDKKSIYGEYYPQEYKKVRANTSSKVFQFKNHVRDHGGGM